VPAIPSTDSPTYRDATGYMLNHLDSVIARLTCYMLTDKDFSDFQVIYVTNSNLQPITAFLLRLNFFSYEPICQRTI